MKIIDTVRRSGRSLKSAKLRTLLTALAISVGAFTLTLTLAASNGLRDYTDKLVSSNFDPAELIVGRDKEVTNTGAPSDQPQEYDPSVGSINAGGPNASLQVKQVTKQDVESLRANPEIEQVRENFVITIEYVTREGQKNYTGTINAYNPAQKPELSAGELPEAGDIAPGTILLPEAYVALLGFDSASEAVGEQISIQVEKPISSSTIQAYLSQLQSGVSLEQLATDASQPDAQTVSYTVSGVTKKSATNLTFGTQPLLISSPDARQLYDFTAAGTPDYEKYLVVYVRVRGGEDETKLNAVKSQLEQEGYYVMSSKDLQKAIMQFVDILTIMVGVFSLITIVASVFGIVNTQYISVLERTREIGLMKALGLSRSEISQLFMFEATWIGFLGGLIGSGVGLLLGVIVNPAITKELNLGEGNSLLIFQPVQMVLLLVALMLVATFAGLLPARKAAKLDPIEALRTE